jgi:hypothetical protein
MQPKSNTLFHFTKSLNILQKVLEEGFWPRYCQEDMAWFSLPDLEYISYPTVCFCDIPLSRIDEHVGFYGNFGLGMSREWAERNHLNPVLYLAGSNQLSTELRELATHANKLAEGDQKACRVTMRYIYSHVKPMSGTMVIGGNLIQKAFYQESEWRFVPKHSKIKEYLRKDAHADIALLEEANALSKEHCLLKFTPADVKYIFVQSDADIPLMVDYIHARLDQYPAAALKILISRIVSLQSLQDDL